MYQSLCRPVPCLLANYIPSEFRETSENSLQNLIVQPIRLLILQISESVLLRSHLADAVLQPRHVRADGVHAEEEQRPLAEGRHQPQHHQEDDH